MANGCVLLADAAVKVIPTPGSVECPPRDGVPRHAGTEIGILSAAEILSAVEILSSAETLSAAELLSAAEILSAAEMLR
jgi:hypothetical protein